MIELDTLAALRSHISLLLAGSTLCLACTTPTDPDKAAENPIPTPPPTAPEPVEAPTPEQPQDTTPATTAEPEPEPTAPPPLPAGANFCFAPSKAAELALPKTTQQEGCPSALDPRKTPEHTDAWIRRTGGPWTITVPFVASDTPAGDETRCCYGQTFVRVPSVRPTRGRPLLVESPTGPRVLLPEPASSVAAREGWLADAQVELASVAAFARANLELLQLGAPPQLILANLRAARDEIEHTRMCLERGACTAPLGALELAPARPSSAVELAVRTLLEACIPETLGTLAAARSATRARLEGREADAAVHSTIATDEARHAALAWATLRWARSLDPRGVDSRLRELEGELHAHVRATAEAEPALDVDEAPQLWAELIEPLNSVQQLG